MIDADGDGDYKVFRKGCLDCSPIYMKAEGVIRILTITGFYGCAGFLMVKYGYLLDEASYTYLRIIFWICYFPGVFVSIFIFAQALRAMASVEINLNVVFQIYL